MATEPARRPIGVFDSGIGGLTVVRALSERARGVPLVYFGDTARVPYGGKSDDTVARLSLECIHFLSRFDPALLVVACNTASAVALPRLVRSVEVPVVGMIDSGVRAALAATKNGRIGVIGTAATIRSRGYETLLRAARADLDIVAAPCPLLVPLVEEGWIDHPVTRQVVLEYLAPLLARDIDTLILGCTHYPLLKSVMAAVAGPGVTLIDSGEAAAALVVERWPELTTDTGGPAPQRFFVSDDPARFARQAERFLGRPVADVTLIEQSDLPWYERRAPQGEPDA